MAPLVDQGTADFQQEGTYRRGYHQAVADVAVALRANLGLSGDDLLAWVEGDGMHWRKDADLRRMLLPPHFAVASLGKPSGTSAV